ncbi:MAG: 50S ribosomal protein L9 [Nitrosopumilus sp.]|nr:50S ribosomal protein L9 [Nitrosopumilus sp.]
MEVILKQDVEKLGYKDDVVKVKPGFARNYLIPQGMAIIANQSNRKQHSDIMKQREFKLAKIRQDADGMAAKLEGVKLQIGAKVGDTGRIYGSVTTIQVADALKAKGYDIDRKNITLPEDHIKTLGTYHATITLHKDKKADVEFEVVAE